MRFSLTLVTFEAEFMELSIPREVQAGAAQLGAGRTALSHFVILALDLRLPYSVWVTETGESRPAKQQDRGHHLIRLALSARGQEASCSLRVIPESSDNEHFFSFPKSQFGGHKSVKGCNFLYLMFRQCYICSDI